MQTINYQLRLLFIWIICYLVMLVSYISGQGEDVDKLPRMLELFGAISAVILPQIVLMLSYYFERNKKEVENILADKPNSKLACWFSSSYILLYTIFIVIAIPFDKIRPFGWDRSECTFYSILIMGNLGIFSTYSTAYLFKIERLNAD